MLNDMENAIFRLEMDGKSKETSDKSLKAILEKYLPGYVQEKLNSSRTT